MMRAWLSVIALAAPVQAQLLPDYISPEPYYQTAAPTSAIPPAGFGGNYFAYSDPDFLLPPSAEEYNGPLLERPKLTGDWFGLRTSLQDSGIKAKVSTTQYYQGVASGGLQQAFAYGGRNDYFLNVDGEKLGLWQGISLNVHGETRYGESANPLTGALSSVNEYLQVPGTEGIVSGLTGFEFNQVLSESTQVYAGKINLLDHVLQPLTGATGLEGFQNLSLIINPIVARTLPYSSFGAGVVRARDGEPVFSLAIYDTTNRPTMGTFENLFANGAVILGTAVLPTTFFDRPGHQGIEGTYSSGRYTNLTPSPYLDPISGLAIPGPPQTGSWCLGYIFDQALWVSPDNPQKTWGLFGKFGISDGNPNPVRWSAVAGVSGSSPIPGRLQDTFGAGFYHLGLSDSLKQSALPLSPLTNEQGVELFYNTRVTRWCQVTPDLQVIEPFQQSVSTALLFGMRVKIDF